MKKILVTLASLVLCGSLLLGGCGRKGGGENAEGGASGSAESTAGGEAREAGTEKVQGIVIEIREGSLVIVPDEGSWVRSSSDQVVAGTGACTDDKSKEALAKLAVGDTVEVTFGGSIRESYPAGLDDVTALRLVSRTADEKKPSVLIFTGDGGITRFVLKACGYGLTWPVSDKENEGVEACGIGPLDEQAEKFGGYRVAGDEFAVTASCGWPVEKIRYQRWSIDSIGNYDAAPLEEGEFSAGEEITLLAGSAYGFHAEFETFEGISGNADYILILRAAEN